MLEPKRAEGEESRKGACLKRPCRSGAFKGGTLAIRRMGSVTSVDAPGDERMQQHQLTTSGQPCLIGSAG